MRKTRNPRYAPEFLERKLSPSDLGLTSAAPAVVYSTTTFSYDPGPGAPPPPPPAGPVGPALDGSTV